MLTIELVPKTMWLTNLRSELSNAQWDTIRKDVYRKASYCCEACGGKGPKWPVECHEIWHFNDKTKTQTLMGLIALCPSCHEVKHIGFASTRGRAPQAAAHLTKVNDWTRQKTEAYIQDAFRQWRERSEYQWLLDISWVRKQYREIFA